VCLPGELNPRAGEHGDLRQLLHVVGAVPAVELGELVCAHQQPERRLRAELEAQLAQRVEGVARGARCQLARIDLEAIIFRNRKAQHRHPVLAARHRGLAVTRRAGGHEQQLLEAQRIERGLRHRQMRVVHRVEGAAQNTDAQARISP